MEIDQRLTQLGLKMKQLVVLDLNFPEPRFPQFKSAYDARYIHVPSRQESAVGQAIGLASLGKHVLVFGAESAPLADLEPTMNIHFLKASPDATWESFESAVREFGPTVLTFPASSSSTAA